MHYLFSSCPEDLSDFIREMTTSFFITDFKISKVNWIYHSFIGKFKHAMSLFISTLAHYSRYCQWLEPSK